MNSPTEMPLPLDHAPNLPNLAASRGNSRWPWLMLAALVLVLVYPIARKIIPAGKESPAKENLLQISALKYQNRQYQESIQAAREYLRVNPASADAYNNLAVSYLGMAQYDEANRNIMEALRLNPGSDLAKRNSAWIASEREKAQAPRPAPNARAGAMVNLSLQQYNAKNFTECIASAKSALVLEPAYVEAYNNIAACEMPLKHYDAAIAAAQEALRLRPDFQLARNNLAWAIKERAGN